MHRCNNRVGVKQEAEVLLLLQLNEQKDGLLVLAIRLFYRANSNSIVT